MQHQTNHSNGWKVRLDHPRPATGYMYQNVRTATQLQGMKIRRARLSERWPVHRVQWDFLVLPPQWLDAPFIFEAEFEAWFDTDDDATFEFDRTGASGFGTLKGRLGFKAMPAGAPSIRRRYRVTHDGLSTGHPHLDVVDLPEAPADRSTAAAADTTTTTQAGRKKKRHFKGSTYDWN